jgi:hypothetical protein
MDHDYVEHTGVHDFLDDSGPSPMSTLDAPGKVARKPFMIDWLVGPRFKFPLPAKV